MNKILPVIFGIFLCLALIPSAGSCKDNPKAKEVTAEAADKLIREKVMQLARFEGIKVEIIGVWIWVSNCYAYRKELKGLGFHWARQKQMWYLHFDDFHKFSSKPASMSYIREKYGCVEVRFKKDTEEKKKLAKV